jgi:hypothetical protein
MLKAAAEAEKRPKQVNQEPDDWRISHDPDVLYRAMRRFRATGIMPHPRDILNTPKAWEDDVFMFIELYQFQLDGIPDE